MATKLRVHIMGDTDSDPLAAFRRVNVKGTERLSRQAVDADVRRFFYMSSIKVKWIRRLRRLHGLGKRITSPQITQITQIK